MSKVVAFIRRCLAAGMTMDVALLAAEQFEADPPRSKGAERQARWRERNKTSQSVTRDACVTVSPPSPSASLSPKPPIPSPTPSTPPIAPPPSETADGFWALQPVKYRRSTRPDVRRAFAAAVRRGGKSDDIQRAGEAYYRLPESQKDSGRFAMNAVRLLNEDRWRDFLPMPEPPAKPPTPEMLAWRLRHFQQTGEWRDEWGDRPKERAA